MVLYYLRSKQSPKNVNRPLIIKIKKPNSNPNHSRLFTLIKYDSTGESKATTGTSLSLILHEVNIPKAYKPSSGP